MWIILSLKLHAAAPSDQDSVFKFVRTPTGVWVNEVVALAKDPSGVLWAATWGEGLHRIAGTVWDELNSANGFVGDWQTALAVDGHNALWVGTADGLCRIRDNEQTVFTTKNTPSLISHEIRSLKFTHNGNLLLGTEDGYVIECPNEELVAARPNAWRVLAGPSLTEGHPVIDFLEMAPGHIYASLKLNGLVEFHDNQWRRDNRVQRERAYVFGRHESAGGEFLAAHRFGASPVLKWTSDGWIETPAAPDGVRCFAETADGTLLVGTGSGVWKRTDAGWEQFDLGPEIGTPNVDSILPDRNGILWLGCREGLVRGSPRTWRRVSDALLEGKARALIPSASPTDPVHAIDSQSNLLGYEADAWNVVGHIEEIGSTPLRSWSQSLDSRFYVAIGNGETLQISVADASVSRRVELPAPMSGDPDPYMRLYLAPSGRLILLSTSGVYQLEDSGWSPLTGNASALLSEGASAVCEAPDGTLYLSGHRGFFRWDGHNLEDITDAAGVKMGDEGQALVADSNGRIWMGTHGSGVYIFGKNEVNQLTRTDGMRTDVVSRLFQDSTGAVWIAYRRQGLGRFGNGHWLNYGYDHGLPNTAMITLAEYPEGQTWALASNGDIYRFKPDISPPDTHITAAPGQVDAHGVASFSFTGWDAWDETPQRELRYSTRIIPVGGAPESPWSKLHDRSTVVPPALASGAYRFEARAADNDGNVDPTPAVVEFTVLPPLHRRPAFIIPVLFGVSICLVLLLSRYRNYYLLERSQLETERANRSLLAEIAERDRVEQALRRSETHLEQAQTFVRLGSWDLDPKTQTGTWSREMFNLFNRDPALGTPEFHSFIKTVHPEDRKLFIQKHRKLFETGEAFEAEFRSHPDLGPVRYFYNHVRGIRDEHGDIRVFYGVTQDITERRLADRQRDELEEKLRHSQKLEAVGQLVGGIAHDFNNILHALLGFTSMARAAKTGNPKLLEDCLEGIEVAGNRAAELVQQLLTFSRREAVSRTELDLNPVIQEALRLMRSTLPATITIKYDRGTGPSIIHADATQLHQIILNLCTNAAQALDGTPGTICLLLSRETVEETRLLNTGSLDEGDYVVLTVADTGPGIAPETLTRIFDPFFTTKEVGRGTGLGLATVHGIVTSMNGGIAVKSQPGKGTRFQLYFRASNVLEPKTCPEEPSPAPAVPEFITGSHVLLVDDEQGILTMTKTFLENVGFQVETYAKPSKALAAFRKSPESYQVVITDMSMPNMTGLELARSIRALGHERTPLILLSGEPTRSPEAETLFSEVLRKPVNLKNLVEVILRLLSE